MTVEKNIPPIKLKINLEGAPVQILRKVVVPANINMMQLHYVIQLAMGWEFDHLFEFHDKPFRSNIVVQIPFEEDNEFYGFGSQPRVIKPEEAHLDDLFEMKGNRKPFFYTYDFGDSWLHKISFQKVSKKDQALFSVFPLWCVEASGACPPEDSGGVGGYANMLEALADKNHPEHNDFRAWLGLERGQVFDDQLIDLVKINEMLQSYFNDAAWKVDSAHYFDQ